MNVKACSASKSRINVMNAILVKCSVNNWELYPREHLSLIRLHYNVLDVTFSVQYHIIVYDQIFNKKHTKPRISH